jgi:hypothetical protein
VRRLEAIQAVEARRDAIEPPMSLPLASVARPAASAAPELPEDPPTVIPRFQELRVTPHSRLQLSGMK